MATGLRIWNANGVLVFDTEDYALRLVGTLQLSRGNVGSLQIPAGTPGNQPWFSAQFYNGPFSTPADMNIFLQGSVLYYNCANVRQGATIFVDYGWM